MFKLPTLLISAFLLALSLPSGANDSLAAPNWDRAGALNTVALADQNTVLAPLFELARQQNHEKLLSELKLIAVNSAWSAPVRESILLNFAGGMGDLPHWSGGFDVLAYLQSYRPETLVPHDDHPAYGVPLFNVAAAAAGSATHWHRNISWDHATRQLATGPEAWLQAYLETDAKLRPVYVQALHSAGRDTLSGIGKLALGSISDEPVLTLVVAKSALLLQDAELFTMAIELGRGAGLAGALRSAVDTFAQGDLEYILKRSMVNAPPGNASLAMASLAPALMHYPDISELMFQALPHRELGASAALLLSASKDPAVRQRLESLASDPTNLAGKRAGLVIGSGFAVAGGDRR